MRPFVETSEIEVPNALIDQVLGQREACDIIRQAAMQRRHVMLIGEPGTGKSLLGQAMAELTKVAQPEDMLVFANPDAPHQPSVRRAPAGHGRAQQEAHQRRARRASESLRLLIWVLVAAIVVLSVYFAARDKAVTYLFGGLIGVALVLWWRRYVLASPAAMIPKLLVQHPAQHAPFVDATGLHAGALLGDVRHDPYQSGGVETPPHHLVEAGAIHRAHGGVLYMDEVSWLGLETQHHLLTAMQERQFAITGRSPGSSGAMVHTSPAPCDFTLVLAGNIEDLEQIHPALRSRIRGYGYEIYTHECMADTDDNQWLIARLVAQEVRRDGKIPHCSAAGVQAVIEAARQRGGEPGKLSCRFRELGGLIRIAGDIAVREGAQLITAAHVQRALTWSLPIEEQMALHQRGTKTHETSDLDRGPRQSGCRRHSGISSAG